MEAYEIMVLANSGLLLIVTALAGALWTNLRNEQKEHKDNFKDIWQSIAKNNEQIAATLRLAEINQNNIAQGQRQIEVLQKDIREQNRKVNEWRDTDLERAKMKR